MEIIIYLFNFFTVSAMITFAVRLIISCVTEREKYKLSKKKFTIVLFGSLIPIINIYFLLNNSYTILDFLEEKDLGEKERKKYEENPELSVLELIKKVDLELEKIECEELSKKTNSSSRMIEKYRNFYRGSAEEKRLFDESDKLFTHYNFSREHIQDERVKKIVKENELPFSYILALMEEHPKKIRDKDSAVYKKMEEILELFIAQIGEIIEEAEKVKTEAKLLEEIKMKQKENEEEKKRKQLKKEQEELDKKINERLEKELEVILKTQKEIVKK